MQELFEAYETIMSVTTKNVEIALPALLTAVDFCRAKLGMSVDDIAELMNRVECQVGAP